MITVQAIGFRYLDIAEKKKSSKVVTFGNESDTVELPTNSEVSFKSLLEVFGKLTGKSRINAEAAANAVNRILMVKNRAKDVLSGKSLQILANGERMSIKIDEDIKKSVESAIECCTDPTKPEDILEFGIPRMKKLAKSNPELAVWFKQLFSTLKNTGCEYTPEGKELFSNYKYGEKVFTKMSMPNRLFTIA